MEDADRYRCRHLYLKTSDNPAQQAEAACAALAQIDGILLTAAPSLHCVHVIYLLDRLSFEIIVELLSELDFEMDTSVLLSLRRTIYGYLEDTARDRLRIDPTTLTSVDDETVAIPQLGNEKYWDDYR